MLFFFKTLFIFFSMFSDQYYVPEFEFDKVKYIDTYSTQNYIFDYGYIEKVDCDQDGYLVIRNGIDGEIINKVSYDDNGIDTFVYLAEVANEEIIVVSENYVSDNFGNLVFNHTNIIKYDFLGNLKLSITYNEKFNDFHNINYFLVLEDLNGSCIYMDSNFRQSEDITLIHEYDETHYIQYQGEMYLNGNISNDSLITYPGIYEIEIVDNNYNFEYEAIINPRVDIIGDKNGDYYIDDVAINSLGEIYINDIPYESGAVIDYPGKYEIIICGENGYSYTEEFIILPKVTYYDGRDNLDFEDGLEIRIPIRIYTNGPPALLDGESYNSEIIMDVGEHRISIYGNNGFVLNMSFVILPYVIGIDDGKNYEKVELKVFGDASLNGEMISGDLIIEETGTYQLDLLFSGEVIKSYYFYIDSNKDETNIYTASYTTYLSVGFLIVLGVGIFFILRKK